MHLRSLGVLGDMFDPRPLGYGKFRRGERFTNLREVSTALIRGAISPLVLFNLKRREDYRECAQRYTEQPSEIESHSVARLPELVAVG